jgi:hypothetical protein
VAVPEDDVSQYLFGLYRDAGAIRVRRAQAVTLGRVQEEHTRRVIDAWVAATRPDSDGVLARANLRVMPMRRGRMAARLRAALERFAGRRPRRAPVLRASR